MTDPHRDVWNLHESDYPRSGSVDEQLRFLLGYAILAPSSHNSQPWRFRIEGGAVLLFADPGRALPVVDPAGRELVISCGAALEHLLIALWHFGHAGRLAVFPEPASPVLLAHVEPGEPADAPESVHRCFAAITRRRTNRRAYRDEPLPADVLDEITTATAGVRLHVAADDVEQGGIAGLVAEADRIQQADAAYRRELASWMRSNANPGSDGIPGYALGMGTAASLVGPLLVSLVDMGDRQAAGDAETTFRAPALVLLETAADDPVAWLSAGRALARLLLLARSRGVWASYLNPAVEVPEIRERLRQVAGVSGHPQVLIRLGYAEDVPPTPRRTVDEVLE
ncbi:nitroreductase [Methanoculleus sp. FWC-SCC1]|uniref:Nitroreductase n=1 Tax=Methanoculleus frigidifontis TaxID=2584085 RepID=A0ABT8MDF3_9EURY|nr:nitroreductase family protein [Methanoculleus sp. FWC-SCC1]MDN7025977.1 nitroreductase [Methanoculleus sp. FWC-SCC1]